MEPEERDGWPTLADVHAAVLRVDGRLQVLAERQESQAKDLAQHKVDERRELDQIHRKTMEHRDEISSLRTWRAWLAGGLSLLGLIVAGVAGVVRLILT